MHNITIADLAGHGDAQERRSERARYIATHCDIVADGHKLLTLGSHTGHQWEVVAYCESAEMAAALAAVLAACRK